MAAIESRETGIGPDEAPVRRSQPWLLGAMITAALSLSGCGTLLRNAVPTELMPVAMIPGMPDVRAWAGRVSPAMEDDLARAFEQESERDFPRSADGLVRYPHLALSGGGPNGAFGAGLLNGWTSSGQRPVFKIVTGVSTGSLIAPLAFLGPEFDDDVRKFYTQTVSGDVFARAPLLLRLLSGEALADTGPLARQIANQVDDEFLRRIAQAHLQGRRLYIGTVDLDSQNFVVWNMGLIATSGHPDALALFRKVMLASTSVPVAFPPVFFKVEAGGELYDEMHVDGAVAAGVFLSGGVFRFPAAMKRAGRAGREDIFVIHNGQLVPNPGQTARRLRPIAERSFNVLSSAATIGDLFRIYAGTRSQGASFHWITIPTGIDMAGSELFDQARMTELYELGYGLAKNGITWATRPPGLPAEVR
jgi:predicted acylesterase/phospholipase RssA